MLKNTALIFLHFSFIFIFYGCFNNTYDEIKNGPEIYLSFPLNNDTLINDSNLFLKFIVGDVKGVHDVDISIYNEKSGELSFTKFFDHIHDNLFELELNSFMKLIEMKQTQDRIRHTLATGKPLIN